MDASGLIRNSERLAALQRTGLLDTPREETFDRLTRLASRTLHVPVVLVSLVAADRQWLKSAVGLPEPWASQRQTPLFHSFCQHVVASGEPLVIPDARDHPLVCDNRAVSELGVVAYAGVPLVTSDGLTLGAFCAIDGQPRAWTKQQIEILRDLAAVAMTEIELRMTGQDQDQVEPVEHERRAAWLEGAPPRRGGPDFRINERPRAPAEPYRAAEPVEISRPAESLSVNPMSSELRNELRNALNAIIGFSEVLVDEVFGPLNGRQFRYLNNILTSGRDLLQLISEVPEPGKAGSE